MRNTKYIAIKEEGKPLKLVNGLLFKKETDLLPVGKYCLTIEKYSRKASHEQFKYLYGLVYPMSLIALNEAGYEFVNIDQVDSFWKVQFANKEVLNRETGQILTIPLSKSEFTTIDELTYCDAIRNYCSDYLGVSIPDPDPNYKQNKKSYERE